MTVAGDRFWVADGPALRCFALAVDEKADEPPTLTPLNVLPCSAFTPLHICAVDCAADGVRLFVSGSDDKAGPRAATCLVRHSDADSDDGAPVSPSGVEQWRLIGAMEVLTAARGCVLMASADCADILVLDAASAQVLKRFPAHSRPPCMAVVGDALVIARDFDLQIRTAQENVTAGP
jgi:hypothetical protein